MSEQFAGQDDRSAREQAGAKVDQLTGQAQSKVGELASQAQPKLEQAQDRVRSTVDSRTTDAGEQLRSVAEVMRHTSEELRSRGNEPHAKVASQAADRMDRLGAYLSNTGPDDMLADLEDLGRRQPLALAAGGLLVGLAAARFVKASSDRRYSDSQAQRSVTNGLPAAQPAGGEGYRGLSYPTGEPAHV